jgi:hypothetical protein
MTAGFARAGRVAVALILLAAAMRAADIKVDLSKEQVGKPPATFEPMVGTWVVVQDGAEKVIMIDGRPWVASKDNPTKLLVQSARRLYGTSNEELMDNAKQLRRGFSSTSNRTATGWRRGTTTPRTTSRYGSSTTASAATCVSAIARRSSCSIAPSGTN